MSRYKTIKEYAQLLLVKVDFVDAYGRNIGYDYERILEKIKLEFPRARTTKRALRHILYYGLDRSVRLPARLRSRKVLAREYAKMLLTKSEDGVGFSHKNIQDRAYSKFKAVATLAAIRRAEVSLRNQRIALPEKRAS